MGRKKKRAKSEYRDRLGFNPRKYINSSDDFHGGEERYPSRSVVERREPRRGDVWFAELGDHFGTSVQGGCRPVLVISNDMGNRCSDIVNVIPMTSRMKKYYLPSHTIVEESHMSERDENREYETSMANTTTEEYTRNKVEIAKIVNEIAERIEYARSNGL